MSSEDIDGGFQKKKENVVESPASSYDSRESEDEEEEE